MRLSDIMAMLDLTVFPQVALVIFLTVFVTVLCRIFGRSRRSELNLAAMLPLEDGPIHRSTP